MSPWEAEASTVYSLFTWHNASIVHKEFLENKDLKYMKMKHLISDRYSLDLNKKTLETMLKKIRNGWNPEQDPKWIEFHNSMRGV